MLRGIAVVLLLTLTVSAWAGTAEDQALVDAAFSLDINRVKEALAKGANPNAQGQHRGPTGKNDIFPVLFSAILGQPDEAMQVFQAQSNDERDRLIAIKRTAIAEALFKAGARLDRLEEWRQSFLFSTAIDTGNIGLVKLLLDHGASPNTEAIDSPNPPTERAKRHGQESIYNLLVSRGGAPVNEQRAAQIALVFAAEYGDIVGMERAIRNGAKVNTSVDFDTALNIALKQLVFVDGQANAITWLLEHGADPNLQIGTQSPLHNFVYFSAITLHGSAEEFEVLNQKTGVVLSLDSVHALNEEILVRLLAAGAKISGTDEYGWTPLHVAARYDNILAAKILIREGAKIMPRDDKGKTPLDYAESAAMIKLLKQNGATER
jgi:ankyrin repeat protein